MSQIKVTDRASGADVANIPIRISLGTAGEAEAIFDFRTNPDGAQTWPIPGWKVRDFTLHVNHGEFRTGRYTQESRYIPKPESGAYESEAFRLEYRLPRLVGMDTRIHRFIEDDGGKRVYMRSLSAFLLYQRYLRDEDITPQLKQWATWRPNSVLSSSVRYNCLLVFGMCQNISVNDLGWPPFKPQDFGDSYFDRYPAFEALCHSFGFYVLYIALPDNGYLMPNTTEQIAFEQRIAPLVRELYQRTNEADAHGFNNVDTAKFPALPAHLFASTGYAGEGVHPYALQWFDYHPRRDFPAHTCDQVLANNPNVIGEQAAMALHTARAGAPALFDEATLDDATVEAEPRDAKSAPGRQGWLRENDRFGTGGGSVSQGNMDPQKAAEVGGSSLGTALGTSFHSQNGKIASVYDDATASLAIEFLNGSV